MTDQGVFSEDFRTYGELTGAQQQACNAYYDAARQEAEERIAAFIKTLGVRFDEIYTPLPEGGYKLTPGVELTSKVRRFVDDLLHLERRYYAVALLKAPRQSSRDFLTIISSLLEQQARATGAVNMEILTELNLVTGILVMIGSKAREDSLNS